MITTPVIAITIGEMKALIKEAEEGGYNNGHYVQIIIHSGNIRITEGATSHNAYLGKLGKKDEITRAY